MSLNQKFPINLNEYKIVNIDLNQDKLNETQKKQLNKNISIARASIVFLTALANAKGLGGHTGGPYDIVPEVVLIHSIMKKKSNHFFPVLFDEAGHRVAIQYLFAVLDGYMKEDVLFHYREFKYGLYGHPERDEKNGIFFSSGRLGHLWSYVNGISQANPNKKIVLFGSDGSQQEGDNAEAARYCVANNLNIKLLIDDNNVTISDHPSNYLKGYDVEKTLLGHGLNVSKINPEDLDSLYTGIKKLFVTEGPFALINKRKMAIGINELEDKPKAHDVIDVNIAINYLEKHNYNSASDFLKQITPSKNKITYLGSTENMFKCRDEFGIIVNDILSNIPNRKEKVLVVDSDLEGSCGLHHIKKKYPEIYISGGIMERNNFSVAAGFGSVPEKQGIMGTFSAFLEMIISEITMARLNHSNVLAHFSHAGVDDMADNTCHFGLNNFFADNGLEDTQQTHLYFPADVNQMKAMLNKIFYDKGLRFIFSTRSATPNILKENGKIFYDDKYKFIVGKDEIIRSGKKGCIISYGEMLYRSLDAVEKLKNQGIDLTLINKPTLNIVDENSMNKITKYDFVLVVESQNIKTGLGIRFGTWLLNYGFKGKYAYIGTSKLGKGGVSEHIDYQGLSPSDIIAKVKELLK
jgi:transketolase C-terminal domain/subunit/transketolase N-terminal domain/subunit